MLALTSRPRNVRLVPALLILLVTLVVGVGAAYVAGTGAPHCGSQPTSATYGLPFVHPTRPGQCPAYTIADVRAFITARYLHSDRLPGAVTVSGKPPTIQRIAFVSRDSVLVCLVVLAGPFWGDPMGAPVPFPVPANATPDHSHQTPSATAYFVLDARTGNLLTYSV
jgi:hypothetical protein